MEFEKYEIYSLQTTLLLQVTSTFLFLLNHKIIEKKNYPLLQLITSQIVVVFISNYFQCI